MSYTLKDRNKTKYCKPVKVQTQSQASKAIPSFLGL